MRQALAMAQSVLYLPTPNPRVGCVVVRGSAVLGRGATQPVGGPHAEVMALRDLAHAGETAQGATVYVTLEPCCHHGRTPPCVDALIKAKPSRVVFAHFDPNPSVAGRGMQALREAGIEVTVGVCADEALEINPGFISRMTRGVPYVWMKVAASLDGRTALHNRQSQWITGPEARADGHHWRARSCTVLTGIGTVRSDNPQLTVRHVDTPRQPKRAVIDPGFSIEESARVLQGGGTTIFIATHDSDKATRLADQNNEVVYMPELKMVASTSLSSSSRPRVDLPGVMQWLAEHGNNEIHVEAGSGMNGALLQAGCVDELIVYTAPMLMGEGMGVARFPGLNKLSQAPRFDFIDVTRFGADVRLRARVAARWQDLLKKIHLE